ncbi:GntR family transcriptional regulator [Methylobacterium tarhaniae]|uniref:GntR family transcriptional regulator n=1 Tax=Methylobacterium tarhaniae TaxID=1187852 RepID=A0A0J6SR97_9HYPH|nr:GntR family transcriptional regulator [Methylobacterium tarhaniae]KMO35898.1 GntR family transcriptional regulator [Methylobacterium tarhaniae]
MRTNTVHKRAYNQCLAVLAARPLGPWCTSEAELSDALEVSRTTVRGVLAGLAAAGLIGTEGARRHLLRHPVPGDYFPGLETETVAEAVERKFMQWVLQGDCRPGQMVNTSELARLFGVSTTAVREYLTRFSQFGLLKRRENSGWIFAGVTPDFAAEIYEIREMFELRSARRFVELAPDSPAWAELASIEREHHALLSEIDARYQDFSRLDERLHRLIHDASRNRFIRDFYDVISIIFHYHYQWDKSDEKERNRVALMEHLDYIAALRSRDLRLIDLRCRAHLRTARATLLRSIAGGPLGGAPARLHGPDAEAAEAHLPAG